MPIELTGNDLTVEQFARVVFGRETVNLAKSARAAMEGSRAATDAYAEHPAHEAWYKIYMPIREESRSYQMTNP